MFLFLQGSVRTLCRWGGHFSHMSNKISSSLQQCKNYKNRSRFSKVMIPNVLPPFFMVHSVYQWYTSAIYIESTLLVEHQFALLAAKEAYTRVLHKVLDQVLSSKLLSSGSLNCHLSMMLWSMPCSMCSNHRIISSVFCTRRTFNKNQKLQ